MSRFGTRGPLKRLKCKGAGSCRGATERGERRSEGPRGEGEPRGVSWREEGEETEAGGSKHEFSLSEDVKHAAS